MIWLLRPDQPKPREFAPAMTEPTEFLPGLPAVKGKPVHVAFDGGRLTSHAGIVLLASLEQQLKIAERPSACLEDPRDPERIRHGLAEMIRYRALLITARYPRACPGKGRVWLADITHIPTGEGWLYLAVILDRFTRKVVGWAMREHMRAELTMAALTMAVQRRRPRAGLIHHADRGSQYAASDYRNIPQAAAITPSMSRKPNCRDNAPIESVFGTLKTELVHQREYPDRDAARRDLFASIEAYYNRRPIHSAIGYITPEQADRKTA